LSGAEVKYTEEEIEKGLFSDLMDLDVILVEPYTRIFPEEGSIPRSDFNRVVAAKMCALIEIPEWDILAHPFFRYGYDHKKRGFPYEIYDTECVISVFEAMRQNGKVFEINNKMCDRISGVVASVDYDKYKEMVRQAAEVGLRFCMGSDTHSMGNVGKLDAALRAIQDTGIESLVLSTEEVMELKDRRKARVG